MLRGTVTSVLVRSPIAPGDYRRLHNRGRRQIRSDGCRKLSSLCRRYGLVGPFPKAANTFERTCAPRVMGIFKRHFFMRTLDISPLNPDRRLRPLCGAKTRAGGRCRMTAALHRSGRCRLHGGSPGSGKQTPEGRQRISAAMRRYWQAWRDARAIAATAP
jgi:hypothetical protein